MSGLVLANFTAVEVTLDGNTVSQPSQGSCNVGRAGPQLCLDLRSPQVVDGIQAAMIPVIVTSFSVLCVVVV